MSYGNISFFVWQGLNFLVFGIWSNKLFFKEAIMKNEHTQAINAITAEMEDILKFGKRAENTISTYKTYAVPYLEYCFDTLGKSPCESSEKDVRSFLSCIQADRDLDDRTINNAISSIHFLFVSVLNLPWNKYKVPFLTFDEYVPFVPTKEEMEAFLSAVPDLKRTQGNVHHHVCDWPSGQRSLHPPLRRHH